jgi:cell shape-determining protein MreC
MSPYRNSPTKIIRVSALIVLAIALVWFIFSWIRNFRGTTPPVYSDTLSLVGSSRASLIKKVIALQSQLDAKNASLTTLSTLEKENEALKAELGRTDVIKGTLARVVIPPNHSIYDTMVIDVGSDDGIVVGQSVYAFGSIALGAVSDVLAHTSTVLLYSASGRETAGTTTGSDITVTLIGRGGGEYEVRMPRDISFQEGGVISQQSLGIHPLATIQKIITDPRDPFQRLLAKVPVNLQTMKWVVVK